MMKSIAPPSAPFDVTIMPGIVFTVAPINYFEWLSFETKVDGMINALADGIDVIQATGLAAEPIQNFEVDNPEHLKVMRRVLLTYELGVSKITAWTAVDIDTNESLVLTPETIRSALSDPFIGTRFWEGVSRHYYDRLTAKKKSSTEPAGTSVKAPAKPTARAAK